MSCLFCVPDLTYRGTVLYNRLTLIDLGHYRPRGWPGARLVLGVGFMRPKTLFVLAQIALIALQAGAPVAWALEEDVVDLTYRLT